MNAHWERAPGPCGHMRGCHEEAGLGTFPGLEPCNVPTQFTVGLGARVSEAKGKEICPKLQTRKVWEVTDCLQHTC